MNEIVSEVSMSDQAASIISEYTGIERQKVLFFIEQVGLNTILETPSIICVNPNQEERLKEMKIILDGVAKLDESV